MSAARQPARISASRSTRLKDMQASARREFEALVGRPVESTSAVRRADDGWSLAFEVVELERVPDSTSVLGSYRVLVDGDGAVLEYELTRRYHRNQASEADD